ncbi:hypothetical protein ANAEL_03173 [Anaerolineales bacterium]|nr:hypothetical protein ANAEL_03173 [Anaerolineales bacterium]
MISFGFTPTKNDYIKSFRAYYLSNWQFWVFLVLVTILLGIVAISALLSGELRDGYNLALSFIIPLIVFIILGSFLLSTLIINPLKIANKVEKDERLRSPIQYEVSTEQILFKNQFTETKTDWGSFQKFIETEDVFLLVYSVNKAMFQFVPKRAFASSDDEQAFKQLLISKNLKNKNSPLNIKKKPLLIIIIIALLCCFIYLCAASFLYTYFRSIQ